MATRELKDSTSLATTALYGVAKLAADGGTTAGTVVQATDARLTDARTPTAHATSHHTAGTDALAAADIGAQPADSDLTDIAALTPSNDDVLQRKAGAWTNRTLAQLSTDLALNPMTTQDDLIVGGVSGAPARLAKGADGQVLTVDPTTHHLVWATPSGGGGALTVEEVDGTPTDSAVTKIIFPNGTLSIISHEATYTPAGGGGQSAAESLFLARNYH